jgi:hypothetical protein
MANPIAEHNTRTVSKDVLSGGNTGIVVLSLAVSSFGTAVVVGAQGASTRDALCNLQAKSLFPEQQVTIQRPELISNLFSKTCSGVLPSARVAKWQYDAPSNTLTME